MKMFGKNILFSLLVLFLFSTISAQEGGDVPQKVQQEVKAHGMTVDQAKSEAKKMGVDLSNPQQAAQKARQMGIPESKIQEMLLSTEKQQTSFDQTSEVQSTDQVQDIIPETEVSVDKGDIEIKDGEDQEVTEENLEKVDETEETESTTLAGLSYFGYSTFQNIPDAFQPTETGPVDDGYLIGPGDELRLIVWGSAEFQYNLKVDKEGRIYIPNVGQLTIANKSLERCREEMKTWLSRRYNGLVSSPPTISMDLSITRIRPIRVFVLGEVARPGGYSVSSYSTIFNVLYSVGGPLTRGSLRNVQLIRKGNVIATVDFYNYLLKGYEDSNIRLQNNDHIFIPLRGKTVSISGQVNRPAIFELKKNEDLHDLLYFAGDLKPEAYIKRFQLERIIPFAERSDPSIAREIIDEELDKVLSGKKKIKLSDGDRLNIFSILDILENIVKISGAVYQPGTYELNDSIKYVKDLIKQADGLTGDAYLHKAELYRLNLDGTQKMVSLDLDEVFNNQKDQNLLLQPEDSLKIFSVLDLKFENMVKISGRVRIPGTVALVDSMTVYDLLFHGGGLQDDEYLKTVYLERADLVRKDENGLTRRIIQFDLEKALQKKGLAGELLQADDEIIVYPKNIEQVDSRIVTITGKIKNPGPRPWRSNMRLKDLLFSAEGLMDQEYLKNVYLERADIIRKINSGIDEIIIPFNLSDALSGNVQAQKYILPDDVVKIYPIDVEKFRNKYVTIKGAVKNPGQFTFKENMNLVDLLIEAGGFNKNAYINSIEISRLVQSSRINSAEQFEKLSVDFTQLDNVESVDFGLDDSLNLLKEAHEFKLKHRDIVFVRVHPLYIKDELITLEGEVMFPGEYTLLYEGEKLSEVLKRAGGLTDRAYPEGGRFYRNGQRLVTKLEDVLHSGKKDDLVLLPGDRVFIPPKPNVVAVSGNVSLEGFMKYQKGKRVFDYIDFAGGLGEETERILVTFPSGETIRMKKIFGKYISNPKVEDGTNIVVTKKPQEKQKEDVDIKQVVVESMALLSSALTIIVLANRL